MSTADEIIALHQPPLSLLHSLSHRLEVVRVVTRPILPGGLGFVCLHGALSQGWVG
jgi:hypothetical protein